MKIGVIGCGAYGIALSKVLNENKNEVTIWTKFRDEALMIRDTRMNSKCLPNVIIDEEIKVTDDINEVTLDKDIIVIATPSFCFDDIAYSIKDLVKDQIVVIATKGLDVSKKMFLSDIWKKYNKLDNVGVIAGGSFAIDIVSCGCIGLTLASKNKEVIDKVRLAFSNNHFVIEECSDVLGVEILSSFKNILAIGCGILDGLGSNESTKSMFLTKSLHDLEYLLTCFNARKDTIMTYAGFGDILLTCTSPKSRNFSYGITLASRDINKIKEYESTHTIEGKLATLALYEMCRKKDIDINILNILYGIIYEDKSVDLLINYLSS